jgi:ATP-dependent RNA helicase DeaD
MSPRAASTSPTCRHVINYTFPESAEVYVHRTGRTGRAGKRGIAISLISPRELGNFYYLKLTYKIRPEERALPTEADLQTLREGQYYGSLQKDLGSKNPGPEFRSLLRRLLASETGESVLAQLLEQHLLEVPSARLEVPSARSEVPSARLEVPSARSEVPSARSEVPSARLEVPSARLEVPSPRLGSAIAR